MEYNCKEQGRRRHDTYNFFLNPPNNFIKIEIQAES